MKRLIIMFMLVAVIFTAGCDQVMGKTKAQDKGADLIYVQIVFDNGEKLNTYVKELGIGKGTNVYAGGTTNSGMYDAQGNLVGTFNYGRVTHMTVLAPTPE